MDGAERFTFVEASRTERAPSPAECGCPFPRGGDHRRGFFRHRGPAAQALSSWAQATEVTAPANAGSNPSATFVAISCSSAGNCTATGHDQDSSGNTQAIAAIETSGTWAQATEVTAPADAGSNPSAGLVGSRVPLPGTAPPPGVTRTAPKTLKPWRPPRPRGPRRKRSRSPPRPMPDRPECLSVRDLVFLGRELHRRRRLQRQLRRRPSHGGHGDLGHLGPGHRGHRPGQCRERPRRLLLRDLVFLSRELHRRRGLQRQLRKLPGHGGHRDLGTWARATEVTAPANAGSNPSAYFSGISCSLGRELHRRRGLHRQLRKRPGHGGHRDFGHLGASHRDHRPGQRRREPLRFLVRYLMFLGRKLHRLRSLLRQLRKLPSHGRHRDLRFLGASHRDHRPGQCGKRPFGVPVRHLMFLGRKLHRGRELLRRLRKRAGHGVHRDSR